MSQALREHYGFRKEDTSFLDAFVALPSFDEVALVIIRDDLERGVAPLFDRASARLIQAYEKMFCDAMAAAVELS
jgi:hypothetical protein